MISTSAPRSSRHAAPARRRSADPRPQATLSPLRLNSYSVSPADLVVSLSLEAVPAAVIRCWTAAAVKAVWALTAARTGTRWRGGKAHGPWPSSQACSYSAGGMSPSGPYSRRLLDQPAHQAVVASTWDALCQGPRWRISSALYNPMIVSARALSQSPLEPAEVIAPACSSRAV